jgi:hypothetical protein
VPAHEKEGTIRCDGKAAVAVLIGGDWICARCGEPLTVLHEAELLATVGDNGAAMLQWSGAGGANGGANL